MLGYPHVKFNFFLNQILVNPIITELTENIWML